MSLQSMSLSVSFPQSWSYDRTLFIPVFLAIAWVVFIFQSRTTLPGGLPVPSGAQWLWGHEKVVFVEEPGQAFLRWIKQLGFTFRIKAAFGAPDVLVVCDPGAIAYILQKKIYDYHHSRVVRPRVARLLGRGLGWIEGEAEHRSMRQLISPALSAESIRDASQDVLEATSVVISDLTSQLQLHDEGLRLNILEWTSKATLSVIGRVAFSHDFNGGKTNDAQEIIGARRTGVSPIVKYVGFISLMLLRRFSFLNDLPISAIQGQGLAKNVIQSGVAHEMLRRNREIGGNKTNDLLSRLLDAHSQCQITERELFEQISTFVISGHETTTQTLGFTIFELARNPDVQYRLREELLAFPGEPTYDDYMQKLPYLDAVLRETLRLYPGLPYMERVATKTDTIPLRIPIKLSNGSSINQIPIMSGQTVIIPIMSIHRLDSVWSDGNTFRPERWLEPLPSRELLCSGWSNTLAFSDGPRKCIGFRLAIYQYKVILVNMLRQFNFKDTGVQINLKVSSSLQPWVIGDIKSGPQLPVIIEPR